MEELVYFNAKIIPRAEARVSVLDYGFLFGYGLYETLRAYDGRLFRLDAHIRRLEDSAREIGINLDVPALRQGVLDTVEANGFADTRVRVTVSLGEGSMTPNLGSCAAPTTLVLAGEYHPFSEEKYAQGFSVIVSSIRKNSRSPVTFKKSANSMENMLARQEAKKAGADEALFLNERGYITEASGSNVFFIEDETLVTPRLRSGILPGVTRAAILELAEGAGLKISEINVRMERILGAGEAFVTNSLIEVMPVTVVMGNTIGPGSVGPVTRRLMDSYHNLVLSELRAQ